MKNRFMLSKCGWWFFTPCFIHNTFYLFYLFIYCFSIWISFSINCLATQSCLKWESIVIVNAALRYFIKCMNRWPWKWIFFVMCCWVRVYSASSL